MPTPKNNIHQICVISIPGNRKENQKRIKLIKPSQLKKVTKKN